MADLLTPTKPAKGFRSSTHRSCPPADTRARITPHLARAGITRVADITGLDRIGIPVTLAIRPNARTVVGSTGKGTTLDAAWVSGAMEAIEMHHAEHADFPVDQASVEALRRQQRPMLAVERLPLVRHQRLLDNVPIPWTGGEDVASGQPIQVPLSCVHLRPPRSSGQPSVYSPFQRGSNGLASQG